MAEMLANHTTLRVGGPVADFVVATTEAELVAAVREADEVGKPVLVLGGGSNLLVSDSGFDGRVVAVRTAGVGSDADACGGASWSVCCPWPSQRAGANGASASRAKTFRGSDAWIA